MALVMKGKIGDRHGPLPEEIDSILQDVKRSSYGPLENVMNAKLVAILRNYEGGFSDERGTEITIAKTVPAHGYTINIPSLFVDGKEYVGVEAFKIAESKGIKPEDYDRLLQPKPVKGTTTPNYYPILQIVDHRCDCGCGWRVLRFSIPQKGVRTGGLMEHYDLDPKKRELIYSNSDKPLDKAVRVFKEDEFRLVSLEGKENLVDKLLEYAADEWVKSSKKFIEWTEKEWSEQ